jgi:EAL domain-containing protein (putative c-di-GMP-specific phosphodiesterase class I)
MSYLRRFPFNGIKIDKSFARDICSDETALAIVQAMLSLGDRLKLVVVAEGVETHRELELLRRLGCRFVQGYLVGMPSDGQKARTLRQRPRAAQIGTNPEVVAYRNPMHRTDVVELAEADLPQ